jgi:transposase
VRRNLFWLSDEQWKRSNLACRRMAGASSERTIAESSAASCRACPKKLLKTGCFFRRVKPSKWMLGDKAYDSAELREDLHERGTKPIIPNRCNRKQPFSFSKRIYKLRWRIESAFNRLKDFRRIATRYDRLARNYLASVCLAAALVWWI